MMQRSKVQRAALSLKRLFDVVVAVLLLVILSPLLALIAVSITFDSPGPVFFRQLRLGRNGVLFSIIKFRTMFDGSDLLPADKGTYDYNRDPRVTRVGRILRRTSLDELPQLLNVVRGEMSLVGPRPALPHHLERYSPEERQRLVMRPGITGLAQVSGRNTLPWQERIQLDLGYVHGWSPLLDLRILLRTVLVVLRRDGVAINYQWRKI